MFFVKRKELFHIQPLVWLGLIIILAFLARSYHITYPLIDAHAFRQTQTAGLIRDFYSDGINLLYPRMITLGDPGYVVLEFPLYQAISAILYNVFSLNITLPRLASILFGLLSIIFVYRLTMRFLDQKAAIFASLFYAFVPLNIFYNRVPMPDTLTILLSLIMFDFLIEGIKNRKNIFLIMGILAGSFGLMMKSPYVAPLYLPIIYIVYKQARKWKSLLDMRFLAAFIVPVTMMVLWQRHANFVNEMYFNTYDYPFKELYSVVVVKVHPFNEWYFGTIAQRLDPQNYLIILKRISRDIFSVGGIIFFIFGILAVLKKKAGAFFFIWLFSALCSIMIFFNLNVMHDFYQLPLAPILSIYCGAGIVYFITFFKNKKVIFAFTTIVISLYLFVSFSIAAKFFEASNNFVEVGQFIDNSIEKSAMIAVSQPGDDVWSPVLMYYSNRHGFEVPHYRLNEEMMEYFRGKNIKYLTLIDYDGTSALIDSAVAPYRMVTKNERTIIYDISSKHQKR